MTPFLLIISAPTGAGKTTIAKALASARADTVAFSISATTRMPRKGEQDGREYFFLGRDEFERRRVAGDFLEWAEYSGNLYGTLNSEVERILRSGRHVLLDIEVAGARQIRNRRSDVVSVFVLPPNAQVLIDRIRGREHILPADLKRRLERADLELQSADEYDYIVVNDDRDETISAVGGIIDAESVKREYYGHVEASERLREELRRLADGLGK